MSTKRVAVCISGHVRTWEHTKESFLNHVQKAFILTGAQVDVFIHTYNCPNYGSDLVISEDQLKKMFKDITVKTMVMENSQEITPSLKAQASRYNHLKGFGDQTSVFNVYCSFRKRYLVDELRKEWEKANGYNYDIIMSVRPDLIYFKDIDLNIMTDMNILYNANTGAPDPADECVMGGPRVMEVYVSRFFQIDKADHEHTYIGAAWMDSHIMLRYVGIKAGLGGWFWHNVIDARIYEPQDDAKVFVPQ